VISRCFMFYFPFIVRPSFDFILACPPYHQTSFREPSHPRAKSVPMTSHFGPFSHLVARVLPKIGWCVKKEKLFK
jgi:hypothetical protein